MKVVHCKQNTASSILVEEYLQFCAILTQEQQADMWEYVLGDGWIVKAVFTQKQYIESCIVEAALKKQYS